MRDKNAVKPVGDPALPTLISEHTLHKLYSELAAPRPRKRKESPMLLDEEDEDFSAASYSQILYRGRFKLQRSIDPKDGKAIIFNSSSCSSALCKYDSDSSSENSLEDEGFSVSAGVEIPSSSDSISATLPLNQLPDDILALAFNFLDYSDVCRSLARVSSRFCSLVSSATFLRNVKALCLKNSNLQRLLSPSLDDDPKKQSTVIRFFKRLPNLEFLQFSDCFLLDDIVLTAISYAEPLHLKTLKLLRCSQISDLGLVRLLRYCAELEKFVLVKGKAIVQHYDLLPRRVTNKTLRILSICKKLQEAEFSSCQIDHRGISWLKTCCDMEIVQIRSSGTQRHLGGPHSVVLKSRAKKD